MIKAIVRRILSRIKSLTSVDTSPSDSISINKGDLIVYKAIAKIEHLEQLTALHKEACGDIQTSLDFVNSQLERMILQGKLLAVTVEAHNENNLNETSADFETRAQSILLTAQLGRGSLTEMRSTLQYCSQIVSNREERVTALTLEIKEAVNDCPGTLTKELEEMKSKAQEDAPDYSSIRLSLEVALNAIEVELSQLEKLESQVATAR